MQGLLDEGNKRRKTESTDANSVSSRSHAVLEINVRRSPRNHYRVQQLCAKLALVDLAGSERAAGARGGGWGQYGQNNNIGQKLRGDANISRRPPPPSHALFISQPMQTPTMSVRSCVMVPTSTAPCSRWPTASTRWASRRRARRPHMCPTVTASSPACSRCGAY